MILRVKFIEIKNYIANSNVVLKLILIPPFFILLGILYELIRGVACYMNPALGKSWPSMYFIIHVDK